MKPLLILMLVAGSCETKKSDTVTVEISSKWEGDISLADSILVREYGSIYRIDSIVIDPATGWYDTTYWVKDTAK